MSVQFGFVEEDIESLVLLVHGGDSAGIAEWLADHILRHHDMHALMEFLGRMIFKVWPMRLTEEMTVGPGEFWALQSSSTAATATATSAQMITASLNEDWDMLTALIHAVLLHPEHVHASVTAHLLAALGDGLRAITEPTDQDHTDGSE